MIIIGAKGFAVEVLEIYNQLNALENIVFFDDITKDLEDTIYHRFKIIKSLKDAECYMKSVDASFTLGIGDPKLRKGIANTFMGLGGELVSSISPKANIGAFGNTIGKGSNIMTGVIITNNVSIGEGCLINLNCTIGHDSILEDYVELSPDVNISGRCKIGAFTSIGTGAVVIPDIVVGKNCVIAAGAVVTKDIPDNCMVAGIPAVIKKALEPLKF